MISNLQKIFYLLAIKLDFGLRWAIDSEPIQAQGIVFNSM